MMDAFLKWVSASPTTRVPILAALLALMGAIIGGFFTVVFWPTVREVLGRGWTRVTRLFSRRHFELAYLEWLIKEHRYLPILPTTLVPISERKPQELDHLYVSLSLSGGKAGSVALADVLPNKSAIVILGDPGCGKTTMLRFIALTLARARRGRPRFTKDVSYRDEVQSTRDAAERVRSVLGYTTTPLPIFVYLNRLSDVTKWPSGRSLLDAIRDELRSVDALRDLPERFFEDKIRGGECAFIFDAFDELGTTDARAAVSRHVGELCSSALPSGNRVIVSSRIVGYGGQLTAYGFESVQVQPLSWDLVSDLVKRWYAALNEPLLADQLMQTLRGHSHIAELAVNPMLLSLIVLVQYVRRLIPDRRHVLYDECVKILVERRYAPPRVQEQYNEALPGDEAVQILKDVASIMHERKLRELSRTAIESEVLPKIVATMPNSRAARLSPPDILRNIEQRSQLLIERGLNDAGQPVMAFSHLTFQEYLTSVALKEATSSRGELHVTASLLDRYEADPEWWEEVALLYAAQLTGEQQQRFLARVYPSAARS